MLTVEDLRRKARDRTPLIWYQPGSSYQLWGQVTRVAQDGSWADFWWFNSFADLRDHWFGWRKRQPLPSILQELHHG